jgi:hypothetical protein
MRGCKTFGAAVMQMSSEDKPGHEKEALSKDSRLAREAK